MEKWGYTFVLLLVLTTSLASAEITLSEPLDIYNLGDRLYVNVDGLVGSESGNLNIGLICKDTTTNLVKISSRAFSATEEQSYSIPYKILDKEDLEINDLNQILGECQIITSLGNKISSSKTFTITDEATVGISLDKTNYNPGEAITASVEVIKKNGHPLNGFIESSNASNFKKAVENGKATEVFSLSKTVEAGIYYLDIYAYDTDSSGILNSGKSTVSFKINQIASSLVTSLSNSIATPEENFTIGIEIFDQSGIKMNGTIDTEIISPNNEVIETTIQSGEFKVMEFLPNSSAGTWKIKNTFNNLIEEREFEMEEIQKVEFDFDGSVLAVTNIGNVLYNKSINVQIGEGSEELELKIGIGETRKFNLGAPNGEYEVLVDDGETSINRQILLTGNVISVNNLKEFQIFKNSALFWTFLIAIIGTIGMVFFKKFNKTRTIEKNEKTKEKTNLIKKARSKFDKKIPKNIKSRYNNSLHMTNKSPAVQSLDSTNYSHEDKSMIDMTKKKIKNAESSLTLKGEKRISSVIALRIKNHEELSDIAKEYLHKIIESEQKKGLVDWKGDYIFIVFSPLATRTYHNEILASKVAMEILRNLNEYNKKFKDKIEFNIGINAGEMITSKNEGKLKYMSIGNTISFAKRIAGSNSEKVSISEPIRKKLLRDLKVKKGKDIGENQIYEILEIRDRSANAEKLKELMRRMD